MSETDNSMVSIKEILQGLKTNALTVCDTVYTQTRPSATNKKLNSFIVVSLPAALSEEIIGAVLDWWVHTIVYFEIYVKDKSTSANPDQVNIPESDKLITDVVNLFPIIIQGKEHTYTIADPDVMYFGRPDGNGFHETLIQATLTTI